MTTSDFDPGAMEAQIKAEALSVLRSVQAHAELPPSCFEGLRAAVEEALERFQAPGAPSPAAVMLELAGTASALRSEATAARGRAAACREMAAWLEAACDRLKQ